ncbi:MAG TPA: hypothetical protein VIK56_09880 [Rhodoferax sp.]
MLTFNFDWQLPENLPASLVAGALWALTPGLAFVMAAALSLAALVVFAVLRSGAYVPA